MRGENTIELTYSGQMSARAKRRKRTDAGCVRGYCKKLGQPGLNSCDEVGLFSIALLSFHSVLFPQSILYRSITLLLSTCLHAHRSLSVCLSVYQTTLVLFLSLSLASKHAPLRNTNANSVLPASSHQPPQTKEASPSPPYNAPSIASLPNRILGKGSGFLR
jgi:hypothetical protein